MAPPQARARTRTWVLHPDVGSKANPPRRPVESALEEAVALAEALPGLDVVGSTAIRLARPNPGTLFGAGRVAELGRRFKAAEVELVLVDGPLAPVQQRNLEKAWSAKILDRTGLILEIFSDRARTREGVLQVELAALTYQRTRLVRAWTHLERQRGGLGFVGGPGETQIEADRRAIDARLVRIRRQLEKVVRTRGLHRAARTRVPYPVVALVGYTNAGKSTLFNKLTGARVPARDMPFATLDPTMRLVRLPSGPDAILSDTVGFITDLPTEMVAAFRATLEEVRSADLIVNVRDASHPDVDRQAEDVAGVLSDLGIEPDRPRIDVWNKIDRLAPEDADAVRAMARRKRGVVAVSAADGEGVQELVALLSKSLSARKSEAELLLDHEDGRRRAWLFAQDVVRREETCEEGQKMLVNWTDAQAARFARL